jgi:riboflavin biosynthesis pyrimidine reductase
VIFVFSNLATSVDGKIATQSREFFPLGTPADWKQMQVLRREADAI